MSSYDNQWTISYTLSNNVDSDEKGIFLGNGKIGLVSSFNSFDVDSTMITSQLKYSNGSYKSNLIEPFYVTNVQFFDNNPDNVDVQITKQDLNMGIAILTTEGSVQDNIVNKRIDIQCETFTPQQLPFSIIQTYKVTPDTDIDSLDFFHDMYAKDNIVDVEYNNNVIFNDNINANKGVYILSGKGRTRVGGEKLACASCYLIEMEDDKYHNMGFNVYRNNLNRCYNKFRLNSLSAGITYKIHIISSILTENDFDNPYEEVKRIVLNVINKGRNAHESMTRIRTEHCQQWDDIWQTDVNVIGKQGITSIEANEISMIKRNVRYSLYNIFSSIRENVNVEVNPMNLSVIDHNGSLLYDGDIWFVPLLILIKPDVARILLEYRYNMISVARQLASGYGYKGSKFPYMNDSVGYKNALYYDTVNPLSVFNTALVAINVWNYFRVSRDRDWLISKGYPILKDTADFFTSKIVRDSDNSYHLRNVVGLSGKESEDNNAFTNNLVRLALRCAIEATYELNYFIKDIWLEHYYNLPVLLYDGFNDNRVIKFDSLDETTTKYDVLEPLFNLIPYYSYLYFAPDTGFDISAVKDNIDKYINKLSSQNTQHPYNNALLTICYGLYSQFDATYVNQFKHYLVEFINSCTKGVWNHLGFKEKKNDIIMNSILVFVLVQGVSQLNVQGGVAETRFYYEEMRLDSLSSANMPNTWKHVRILGAGMNLTNFTTTNSLYYV